MCAIYFCTFAKQIYLQKCRVKIEIEINKKLKKINDLWGLLALFCTKLTVLRLFSQFGLFVPLWWRCSVVVSALASINS